ncbi:MULTISPECIES: ATP-binding cassette domain-containing protein [Paraburkholderia]|uniref:ATP-binding cassette domain-containing protein n=1 Tax=Paraburkholderia TaxID=1822464 RepID=UPI00034C9965|nr:MULTISPECIES: ATP-binding cassette domain-containing protein [Paraburkholderia]WEY42266.1 ATP-binding cassette domain-containing protein [Paraburkholderia sp. SUR17]
MIDIDLDATVCDGARRFTLATRFISDAQVVALYGPSGGGKSMTLQAMAGLLKPQHGHVRIGARVLFDSRQGIDLPPEQRSVGYLFQHYALFPHLNVRDNIAFGLTTWQRRRLSHDDARHVDELLETFGLAALASSRPATLSGGQQQRVALARALACRPGLLLLDEPFAALNPLLRDELRGQLGDVFARWQMPVVMITHDIDDVLALADVAFIVESGRVIREVDVRSGESRAMTTRALLPGHGAEPLDARARRVRELLHVHAAR